VVSRATERGVIERRYVTAFLVKQRGGAQLHVCRGPAQCSRSIEEKRELSRKNASCPECVPMQPHESLDEALKRIARGDA
jgi:hypothetical protein